MDQHQISSSPRDIPVVKMPKIAFAVLQFQGGQCCTGRPELRDSPFCQKSGSISFRHNIKVTTGRSINIQCPIFAEVIAIFLTPPLEINAFSHKTQTHSQFQNVAAKSTISRCHRYAEGLKTGGLRPEKPCLTERSGCSSTFEYGWYCLAAVSAHQSGIYTSPR